MDYVPLIVMDSPAATTTGTEVNVGAFHGSANTETVSQAKVNERETLLR